MLCLHGMEYLAPLSVQDSTPWAVQALWSSDALPEPSLQIALSE